MPHTPLDWPRLARAATARRRQLDLTQPEVTARGGPAVATLRLIETAGRRFYRPRTTARLERALGWRPGSVAAVLAGGEPTPVPGEVGVADPVTGESYEDPVECQLWRLRHAFHPDPQVGAERAREHIRLHRLHQGMTARSTG